MKTFASASFFRLFDILVAASNPGLKRSRWGLDGVEFEHIRHSFAGSAHGFTIETFTLAHPGRRKWSLLVVKEFWWIGEVSNSARITRWARPTRGRRADIIAWLETEQAALERTGKEEHSITVQLPLNAGPERER
jgi:hypothetical protein